MPCASLLTWDRCCRGQAAVLVPGILMRLDVRSPAFGLDLVVVLVGSTCHVAFTFIHAWALIVDLWILPRFIHLGIRSRPVGRCGPRAVQLWCCFSPWALAALLRTPQSKMLGQQQAVVSVLLRAGPSFSVDLFLFVYHEWI